MSCTGLLCCLDRAAGQARERTAIGRKPSDDYEPGERGKWGEPYELIDYVEGDDGDEDEHE